MSPTIGASARATNRAAPIPHGGILLSAQVLPPFRVSRPFRLNQIYYRTKKIRVAWQPWQIKFAMLVTGAFMSHFFQPLRLLVPLSALLILIAALGARPALAAGVVGTGTPASCTETALDAKLNGGGL